MKIDRIGVVGIGTMGRGIVQNLLKNGFNVSGYNRTKSKIGELKHENFQVVNSPKEVCENSDLVITFVSNDEALKEVMFSKDGIFQALGKNKILIDCGTTSVNTLSRNLRTSVRQMNAIESHTN